MPTKPLHLVAIGAPAHALLKDLEEPLTTHLGAAVTSSKDELPTPTYAFNKDRNQYNAAAIMRRLSPLLDAAHPLVLGLTDVDLFVPDAPFIFGDADRESRTGVVSTFRLKQGDPEAVRRRLHAEVVHQAGHLVGLTNCEDARCAMFNAQTLADFDRRALALCNVCRNELAKLGK